MNIVYATSDLYSKPALISIKTLLMNNTDVDEIHIYYVENDVTDENRKLLKDLVAEYNRDIQFISMPEKLFEVDGFVRNNLVVYSYCYFQDILPGDVDKVLLLEGDCIVVDNLKEMYETDLTGCYFAAVDDMENKNIHKRLGINIESPYANCGVILFNLEKMRRDNFSEKITKIIKSGKSKYFWEVQDEMNVLAEGKIKFLPLRFNVYTVVFLFSYKNMIRFRRPSTCYTEKEYIDARENPVIVHFTKAKIMQSRPWIENCRHPYNQYYLNAKADTALANMELWTDNRGVMCKLFERLYFMGLKSLVAAILGYIRTITTSLAFIYKHI